MTHTHAATLAPKRPAGSLKITVCGSMATEQLVADMFAAGEQLEAMGHQPIMPEDKMTSDYSELDGDELAKRKKYYVDLHVRKVEEADALVVLNPERKGIPGYIGANTFLEMVVAMYLKKPIYILNPLDRRLGAYDEILAMEPVFLNGDLTNVALS